MAESDELHGEGFVTWAHVESLKGGVGEPRDFNSELEEGLDTVEDEASWCGGEVEGGNSSEKRAREVVIIGDQFRKELQGQRAEARVCYSERDRVDVGGVGRRVGSVFTDAARTMVIQGNFVGEHLHEAFGVVGTS